MSLPERTAESRSALAQSATFAMSLGAKELFHTNFLAFLLESTDAELATLQVAVREALGLPCGRENPRRVPSGVSVTTWTWSSCRSLRKMRKASMKV